MKIGVCILLWTTSVGEEHTALLEDLKATGYDVVEVPIFAGTPDDYAKTGQMLDALGRGHTAISVIPTSDMNILTDDAADRRRSEDYLKWLVDCAAALGADGIGGPMHQTLGHFSGNGTTEAEFDRAREVHRVVGDHAQVNGQLIALEAVNRFETYFANTIDDLGAYTRNAAGVIHVHISANDLGAPGRDHIPWAETFKAIKASGYDGWLTIEAFGRGLQGFETATWVRRDFAESPEAYYREGFDCTRRGWDAA